jgi:hypothetical protein
MQIAFTRKKDFGREERELKWATAQRTLHGLQPAESTTFHGMNSYSELNQLADEARRRAEIARYNTETIYPHANQSPSWYISIVITCGFLQAEGAEHPEGADGVGGKAEGVGP